METLKKNIQPLEAVDVAAMKPQHKNVAIAMVAACITHYWKQGVNLEAILLHPAYFSKYKDFVREIFGEEAADTEDFYWHDIQIRKETFLSGRALHAILKKPK